MSISHVTHPPMISYEEISQPSFQGFRDAVHSLFAFQSRDGIPDQLHNRNRYFKLEGVCTFQRLNPYYPFDSTTDISYETQLASCLLELDRHYPLGFSKDWDDYCLSQYTTALAHREGIVQELSGDYNPSLSSLLVLIRIAEYYETVRSKPDLSIPFRLALERCMNAVICYPDDETLGNMLNTFVPQLLLEAKIFSRGFIDLNFSRRLHNYEYHGITQSQKTAQKLHSSLVRTNFFQFRREAFNPIDFSCKGNLFCNREDFHYQKNLAVFFSYLAPFIAESIPIEVSVAFDQFGTHLLEKFKTRSVTYKEIFNISRKETTTLMVATRLIQHFTNPYYPFGESFMSYIGHATQENFEREYKDALTLLCHFYITNTYHALRKYSEITGSIV